MTDHRATGPEPGDQAARVEPDRLGDQAERAVPVVGPDNGMESFAAGFEPGAEPGLPEPGQPEPGLPGAELPDEVPGAVADEEGGLPDLADEAEFEGALESILLVVDTPIAEEQLAGVLEQSVKRVTAALHRLAARYSEQGSGIDLRRIGDGWRFYTRDRFAPFVEKLLLDGQRAKLTRAALETLAVIAYRQPVTRARIAAVRGVNVDGVIRTLVARGLIAETGTDSDTGGILYRTTELFLERLGLSSLGDLPPIAPLLPEVDAIDDV
ncbi:SMC-Scp complex subunit ScpB [Saccharothrix sp. ALI-22-I]|uniref:SMC-Scp complex subunit ScpB n=1 Tax=Saccharothrix sp. ALI-22-I TaxID=1933778 RepID=UPI001EE76AF6|nr:SMC-Scp complex subunit ScpB [Saccharothrix sp. ALI-22-I]